MCVVLVGATRFQSLYWIRVATVPNCGIGETSMKRVEIRVALFSLVLLLMSYVPLSRADEWDKTTKVTFSEPVQVPGKVLPAGTYVFRLHDSTSNRHIVQI